MVPDRPATTQKNSLSWKSQVPISNIQTNTEKEQLKNRTQITQLVGEGLIVWGPTGCVLCCLPFSVFFRLTVVWSLAFRSCVSAANVEMSHTFASPHLGAYTVGMTQYTIDINGGERRATVAGGQSVLAALKTDGIFLPSVCGGKGFCGRCRSRFTSEVGQAPNAAEQKRLSEEELASGVRLACQVTVDRDLAMEVDPELLVAQKYSAVVDRIQDMTHDIKQLRLTLTEPTAMDYRPGHYIQLESQPYGSQETSVSRAYSLSSVPGSSDALEVMIRKVPDGISTTWVFEHLVEGTAVTITGPHGEFAISDSDAPMVWIAGGSGMSPFWSMVRQLQRDGNRRPVRYFFGAVNREDLFLVDELEAIAAACDWFEFYPVLSAKDAAARGWTGLTGLVTEAVDAIISPDPEAEAYLCGSPGMCNACLDVLASKSIPLSQTYFDKFA